MKLLIMFTIFIICYFSYSEAICQPCVAGKLITGNYSKELRKCNSIEWIEGRRSLCCYGDWIKCPIDGDCDMNICWNYLLSDSTKCKPCSSRDVYHKYRSDEYNCNDVEWVRDQKSICCNGIWIKCSESECNTEICWDYLEKLYREESRDQL